MKQEATSISSDGPSPTPETQIRKVIYEDDRGRLHGVLDTDGRFYIHSELYNPAKLSDIKHYKEVLELLEEQLSSRGFQSYYTFADSPNHFRYCELLGFHTNMEVWDEKYEVMVKEL